MSQESAVVSEARWSIVAGDHSRAASNMNVDLRRAVPRVIIDSKLVQSSSDRAESLPHQPWRFICHPQDHVLGSVSSGVGSGRASGAAKEAMVERQGWDPLQAPVIHCCIRTDEDPPSNCAKNKQCRSPAGMQNIWLRFFVAAGPPG